MKQAFLGLCCLVFCGAAFGQFTRQDTLRGSNGRGRAWWDVKHYDLAVDIDTASRSIKGTNIVVLTTQDLVLDSMQIDLQEPMVLDSASFFGYTGEFDKLGNAIKTSNRLRIEKEGNVWWLKSYTLKPGTTYSLALFYHGTPGTAKNPPWDGGFMWKKDSTGKPWIAVACQGLGASSWWPCKDYQGDEPDNGSTLSIQQGYFTDEFPYSLAVVANGKDIPSMDTIPEIDPKTRKEILIVKWLPKPNRVLNPINTYNLTFYIGDYVSWTDTIMGENGKLDLSFYALRYNEQKAREHFKVVKQMLHCYEWWMGPYPFYEDGYKLVEAPYLGMEHQSAIAYGNEYKMGYRGTDRSGTNVGMSFDYIIVHESGHEWFGNNITAQDIADNWIHEGFTTYTETIFAECLLGKEKAFEYCRGEWKNIRNDNPVIGVYGVQNDGSSDKYYKGAALVHTIRTIMNDDEKFRQLLRGLNKDFYHKIVTSAEVEAYISKFVGRDLTAIFNQYLRSTQIPELEYYKKGKKLFYRFNNIVDGFSLPMAVMSEDNEKAITPTAEWQHVKWKGGFDVSFSKDFLYKVK